MADIKLTDTEIIKALEICSSVNANCEECPCFNKDCISTTPYVLDLIRRQQAELDDLKRDTIPKLKYSLERANKYGIETDKENQKLKALKSYFDSLTGAGLEILGLDQQGDFVSFDTFYNSVLSEIGLDN